MKPSLRRKLGIFLPALVLWCLPMCGQGQGTLTYTFEGQPVGTSYQVGVYSDSGMRFSPIPMGALYLSGGGVTGYPDNGSGYLYAPDNGIWLGFTNTFPTKYFDLLSFDAAEYAGFGSATLTVVGYKPMAGTVTNIFTLDGINDGTGPLQDFQTFNLDSSFVKLFRVDMYARFSLDNLVISGVPEPSSGALILLGTLCGLGWSRVRSKRT